MSSPSGFYHGMRAVIFSVVAIVIGTTLMPLGSASSGIERASAAETGIRRTTASNPIKHIVYLIKENRSFDNYFGAYPPLAGHIISGTNIPGGATSATTFTGELVPMGKMDDFNRDITGNPTDLDHRRVAAVTAIHHGRADGYEMEVGSGTRGLYGSNLTFTQAKGDTLSTYWNYADHFVLSDQTYSSLGGPSFPNHLYTIAGQAMGAMGEVQPGFPEHRQGCDGPTGMYERMNTGMAVFPCWTASQLPNLPSMLEAHPEWGVTWKYYSTYTNTDPSYIYTIPNAISDLRNNPDVWGNKVVTATQFITDVLAGNLPSVSWLIAPWSASEHAPESTCDGQNWTADYLNVLMQSPEWDSTAVFLTWDDFGGFYDHVMPPQVDNMGYGPRVPMLIISPYADHANHAIVDTPYEFSSVLAFTERLFNLPRLGTGTARDASANDMFDAFNFNQTPLAADPVLPKSCPTLTTPKKSRKNPLFFYQMDGD